VFFCGGFKASILWGERGKDFWRECEKKGVQRGFLLRRDFLARLGFQCPYFDL